MFRVIGKRKEDVSLFNTIRHLYSFELYFIFRRRNVLNSNLVPGKKVSKWNSGSLVGIK